MVNDAQKRVRDGTTAYISDCQLYECFLVYYRKFLWLLNSFLWLGMLITGSYSIACGQFVNGQKTRIKPKDQPDSLRALKLIQKARDYMLSDLDSSWYFINQSIKIGKKLSNKRILAKSYSVLATSYIITGESKKALPVLMKAEKLIRRYPFDSIRTEISVRTVQAYRVEGDYQKALQLGLLLNNEVGQYKQNSYINFSLFTELAVLYQQLKTDSLVLPYYQKAYRLALQKRDKNLMLVSTGNLGEYYINKRNFAEAKSYISQSLYFSRQLRSLHNIAENLRNLGEISRFQHAYTTAIHYYKQALRIHQQIGSKEFIGHDYLHLAQSYNSIHKHNRALYFIIKSMNIFNDIHSLYYYHEALLEKINILRGQKRFEKAILLMSEAQILGDSLLGLEKQKAVAEIQARSDTERKQHRIQTLEKDIKLQQKERQAIQFQLKLTQHQRTFFLIVSILLIILVSVIYLNHLNLKKAQLLLRRQKVEIQVQAEQLAEVNKTKDQLFSIISHDLRSLVVRLKQDIHALSLGQGETTRSSVINNLEQNSSNLLTLLRTLFDWAYMQFNGFRTSREEVNLFDVVVEQSGYFKDRINQKRIILVQQVNKDVVVVADKQQLGIVIRNLLDNAIKFTPLDGYIRLTTIISSDSVELSIRDTGIGMTSDMINRLNTQPIVRLGTQGEVGTGLGLKLIKELIENQNGKFLIESQIDKGTTIRILLNKYVSSSY